MTISSISSRAAHALPVSDITACTVAADLRVTFLGKLVGSFKGAFEREVVRCLTELCDGGTLGSWRFVQLSNGGGFLLPPERHYVVSGPNYMAARVTAEIAGIIATLFALEELKDKYRAEGIFALRYWQLHEYARRHAAASQIFLIFEL